MQVMGTWTLSATKKGRPELTSLPLITSLKKIYFLDFFAAFCLITAWAAAKRAIGTLKGEQLT